jgi:hypothetical protein
MIETLVGEMSSASQEEKTNKHTHMTGRLVELDE